MIGKTALGTFYWDSHFERKLPVIIIQALILTKCLAKREPYRKVLTCRVSVRAKFPEARRCTMYRIRLFVSFYYESSLFLENSINLRHPKNLCVKIENVEPFFRDLNTNIPKFISKMTNLKNIKSTKHHTIWPAITNI